MDAIALLQKHVNTLTKQTGIHQCLGGTATINDATDMILNVDKNASMVSDMLAGKTLTRGDFMSMSPTALLCEGVISVYNSLNPRIRKVITDKRLVSIIIKNALGPNCDAFMSLESSAFTDRPNARACKDADCCRIGINRDVSLTETRNDALFPSVYQFGFCVRTVETILQKELPWLGDAYKSDWK